LKACDYAGLSERTIGKVLRIVDDSTDSSAPIYTTVNALALKSSAST
jgi:hypothetical protein